MKILLAVLILLAGVAPRCSFAAEPIDITEPPEQMAAFEKTVTFKNPEGLEAGVATLIETPNGVVVRLALQNIPPGEHAFHIHEKGVCNPDDKFESAGAHYNPGDHQHGFHAADGPHAGDMANIVVPENGEYQGDAFNARVTLMTVPTGGRASLFDEDGSALVIHAGEDDYASQPSGDAGGRIACAEIR